jgi:hypothetical protein
MVHSDPEQATLRFRWTDGTRPSRPRLDAITSGRWVTLTFPATDTGSGVDRYEVSVVERYLGRDARDVTATYMEYEHRPCSLNDPA